MSTRTQTTPAPGFTRPATDMVVDLEIGAGNLDRFLGVVGESRGPRIKSLEGSLTLVSPSGDRERSAERLDALVKAVCGALRIGYRAPAAEHDPRRRPTG